MLSSSKKKHTLRAWTAWYNQYCDGKCLTLALRIGGAGPWFIVLPSFHGLSTFIVVNFESSVWYHWMSSLKEVHTVGPVLRVQARSSSQMDTTEPLFQCESVIHFFYKRYSFPLWHLPLWYSFLTLLFCSYGSPNVLL